MDLHRIAAFEILAELPGSGPGKSYQAVDATGRQVVVKIFDMPAHLPPDFFVRFQRELDLITILESTSIVPIEQIGIDHDCIFIVMPWMAGGSLETRLQADDLTYVDRVEIITSLSDCLTSLQDVGIVHGDIKPSNVLFDEDGRAHLSDFGVIKYLLACNPQYSPDILFGPPAYTSPEQIQTPETVDHRSDLYSFGLLVYQILTGNLLFAGRTALSLALHQLCVTPSLAQDLSREVHTFFQQALAKDRDERFQSASEFKSAFYELIVNPGCFDPAKEPPAKRSRVPEKHKQAVRAGSSGRRQTKNRLFSFAIVLLFLVISASISLALFPDLLHIPYQQIGFNGSPTVLAEVIYVTQTPQLILQEEQVVVTKVIVLTATPEAGDSANRVKATQSPANTPTPSITPSPTATLNNFSSSLFPGIVATPGQWIYEIQYNDTLFKIASQLNVDLAYLMGVNDLFCDSRLYVGKELVVPPSGILVYPTPDASVSGSQAIAYSHVHTLECMRDISAVVFSHDMSLLAVAQGNDIFIWRVADWKPVKLLSGHSSKVSALEFSPDDKLLVSAGNDRTIRFWDMEALAEVWRISAHSSDITDLALSPDGKFLASSAMDLTARVWEVATGSKLFEYRGYNAYSVAYSSDGAALAIGYGDFIGLYDPIEFSLIRKIQTDHINRSLTFSDDGALLAANSGLWYVPEGYQIYAWGNSPHQAQFTPDGRYVLIGQEYMKLLNGKRGNLLSLFANESVRTAYAADSIDFTADGRMLALGNQDGVFIFTGSMSENPASEEKTFYEVQSGDNYFSIAEALDLPLASILTMNGLTCDHIPYPGQSLQVPTVDAYESMISTPLDNSSIQQIQRVPTIDLTCAVQKGGISFAADDNAVSSGLNLWRLPRGSVLIRGKALESAEQNILNNWQITSRAALSPDGALFATASDSSIEIWDANTGEFLRLLVGHTGRVISLAFAPDGSKLVSSAEDQTIRIWDVQLSSEPTVLNGYKAETFFFILDSSLLVSQAGDTARIWDLQTGTILGTIQGIEGLLSANSAGNQIAYIACAERSGSRCLQQVVNLYRTMDGVVEHTFYGMEALIQAIAFAPQQPILVIASEQNIVLWDTNTKQEIRRIRINDYVNEAVNLIRFSPDGAILTVVVNNSDVRFFSVQSGVLLHEVNQRDILDVEYSPSGRLLGILSAAELSIWFSKP